jgi:acetylornithine deacetylase/succinyl-diaminopimelate desuccinylase-like protein
MHRIDEQMKDEHLGQPDDAASRRQFLEGALRTAGMMAAAGLLPADAWADTIPTFLRMRDPEPVLAQIPKQHDATVRMLRDWIALPSIAAENVGYPEGPEYMAKLAREAGFDRVELIPTRGKAGVFATLDAGAPVTLAVYFMYDVKQYEAKEWTSPPLEGRLVNRPGLGTVMVGRGATNTKGPQVAFLAALRAFRAAGRRPPVNLVLVCEGEEEIGSPNFSQIVFHPAVEAALRKSVGIIIPLGSQSPDGTVEVNLGAKGIVELELVATGEKWGRGPKLDIHSSYAAQVDSPAWHLVQALNTLVKPDGHTPAVDGFFDQVRPLTAEQRRILAESIPRKNEAATKRAFGVQRWIADEPWATSLERLVSQPTINIEGLVGGYTGPGGKTILPHRAVAKIDMRLVPDMTAKGTLELLKQHLGKRGFGDIEVQMTGGYDPTETPSDAALVKGMLTAYRNAGVDPILWPRLAGSWPGSTFTGAPLRLAAGIFGLGHGGGAHAPDEYFLIDSTNPKVAGLDGAVASYVRFMFALA